MVKPCINSWAVLKRVHVSNQLSRLGSPPCAAPAVQVLQWERLHNNRCGGPRLKKFAGRPQDYSPKARLLNFLGYKLPFDRHDWVVDRCGKEVR